MAELVTDGASVVKFSLAGNRLFTVLGHVFCRKIIQQKSVLDPLEGEGAIL